MFYHTLNNVYTPNLFYFFCIFETKAFCKKFFKYFLQIIV